MSRVAPIVVEIATQLARSYCPTWRVNGARADLGPEKRQIADALISRSLTLFPIATPAIAETLKKISLDLLERPSKRLRGPDTPED